jgi:Type IV pili methyl-accepting chemotaxis transducer N-term
MKKFITLSLFTFMITANSQTLSLGSAINKAGKQRMLVQRMTKDYMAIGAGVKVEESATDIDDVTALFNENHRDLVNFAKYQEIKDALGYVNELWAKFRLKMASNPDIVNAEVIISDANLLTYACNSVVEKIQVLNPSAIGNAKMTNICGKQRLNLQRISMLYMAKTWGVGYTNLEKDFKEAFNSFDANLIFLNNNKDNTPEITNSLKFQQSEWEFLKKSFENTNLKPGNIYSSTNLMTKDFDMLTGMYEKLVPDTKITFNK